MEKITLSIPTEVNENDIDLYRTLRTKLELAVGDKKVVTVSSSLSGEGKTTVSLNLARSLSYIGKKVLFLDGNLKDSDIIKRYQLNEPVKGLNSYLHGESNIENIICYSDKINLSLILCEKSSPSSTELLDSELFRKLILQLRNEYDYVIIDTPALEKAIDAIIIARESDCVIMVVEENRVNQADVKKNLELLKEAQSHVLGIVMNKVQNI